MIRIAIRADASIAIGTGHLRRCLSLAQVLSESGVMVDLLVRRLDDVAEKFLDALPNLGDIHINWLPEPTHGYMHDENSPLNQTWAGVTWIQDVNDVKERMKGLDIGWMIIDHYAFDARWHSAIRQEFNCKLMVIDDLADRLLDPDALLDQNWHLSHEEKYRYKLRRSPVWFAGPKFALLDKVYSDTLPYKFQSEVKSVGIFMGGTDPGGASLKILNACRESGYFGHIEIASSSANPHLPVLLHKCGYLAKTLLTLDQPNLASFFSRHDLHIGAGGGATWERCCMAAPSIVVALAENQSNVLEPLSGFDVFELAEGIDGNLPGIISALRLNSDRRHLISTRSRQLVDGQGVFRVVKFLIQSS